MTKKLLIAILIVAALLRITSLWQGDLTGSDEIFYGFRAIGMMDYDNAPKQSTPLEWFDPINLKNRLIDYPPAEKLNAAVSGTPWWTRLSFHDHPPLVFLIQHWFMGIFGENKFAFRLPSALAGILSVYLVYLIGKKLFSAKTGLMAAALMAVAVNAVHNSRLGLQEPILIVLMLVAAYFFLLADTNPDAKGSGLRPERRSKKYFLLAGAAWGLALLAKYNAIILAPIFLTYILFYRRGWLKEKNLWIGLLIALALFSPVIIYNLELYRAVGHFDFQLSYLLKQNPAVWQSAPGKTEAGNFIERFKNFLPNLAKTNSWPFLLLAAAGLIWLAGKVVKKRSAPEIFLLAANIWLMLLMLLAIGPAARFLAMLAPWFALSAGALIAYFWKDRSKLAIVLFGILLAWELAYTINTDLLPYPIGPKHFAFSRLRYENYRWGYNELDDFLSQELAGKYPSFVLNQKYQFLDQQIDQSISEAKERGNKPFSAIIVYDNNMQDAGKLWSLDRLQIYHGWPVVKVEGLLQLQNFSLPPHTTYFVLPTDKVILKNANLITLDGLKMEQFLLKKGILPIAIKNQRGETAFRIYKF